MTKIVSIDVDASPVSTVTHYNTKHSCQLLAIFLTGGRQKHLHSVFKEDHWIAKDTFI